MIFFLLAQADLGTASEITRPACVLIERTATSSAAQGRRVFHASCGGPAVRLGQGDSSRSSYNAASRSLLVEMTSAAGKRVVLVSVDSSGVPQIDDVTRELASLSGRYAETPLGNTPVNIDAFAATGIVSVPTTPMAAPDMSRFPTRGGAAKAPVRAAGVETTRVGAAVATLDLKPYAARAAERPPAAP